MQSLGEAAGTGSWTQICKGWGGEFGQPKGRTGFGADGANGGAGVGSQGGGDRVRMRAT